MLDSVAPASARSCGPPVTALRSQPSSAVIGPSGRRWTPETIPAHTTIRCGGRGAALAMFGAVEGGGESARSQPRTADSWVVDSQRRGRLAASRHRAGRLPLAWVRRVGGELATARIEAPTRAERSRRTTVTRSTGTGNDRRRHAHRLPGRERRRPTSAVMPRGPSTGGQQLGRPRSCDARAFDPAAGVVGTERRMPGRPTARAGVPAGRHVDAVMSGRPPACRRCSVASFGARSTQEHYPPATFARASTQDDERPRQRRRAGVLRRMPSGYSASISDPAAVPIR